MSSREVFRADWKVRRKQERRFDWLGRALELLAVALIVIAICLQW